MSRFPSVSKNYNPFETLNQKTQSLQRRGLQRKIQVEVIIPKKNDCMNSYNKRYFKMKRKREEVERKEKNKTLRAVCVLLVNDKNEFLSVSHKKYFDDKSLIGGKVDEEDSTDIAAAIRETREETGLVINRHNMKLIHQDYDEGHNQIFHVKTYYCRKWFGRVQPGVGESGQVEWLPLEKLRTCSKSWNEYNSIVLDKYYDLTDK